MKRDHTLEVQVSIQMALLVDLTSLEGKHLSWFMSGLLQSKQNYLFSGGMRYGMS